MLEMCVCLYLCDDTEAQHAAFTSVFTNPADAGTQGWPTTQSAANRMPPAHSISVSFRLRVAATHLSCVRGNRRVKRRLRRGLDTRDLPHGSGGGLEHATTGGAIAGEHAGDAGDRRKTPLQQQHATVAVLQRRGL